MGRFCLGTTGSFSPGARAIQRAKERVELLSLGRRQRFEQPFLVAQVRNDELVDQANTGCGQTDGGGTSIFRVGKSFHETGCFEFVEAACHPGRGEHDVSGQHRWFRAEPTEVWHKISDYAFDAKWREGLIEMNATPPGPAALGTQVREVLQRGGKTYVGTTTVDEIEPGVGYRFSGGGPSGRITGTRRVLPGPIGGTTHFTYAFELQPGLLIRAVGPIATRIARSAMRRDLQTLRTILEV